MSSASSIAFCIELTVDSRLTTTPFLSPRDGAVPMPIISMLPSLVISPTMAATFDVPISKPTIKLRSIFFAILFTLHCSIVDF